MKELKGKTAVITGAASGIGRGIAERCIKEKMRVVLADVEQNSLQKTFHELNGDSAGLISVLTDVTKEEDVDALARAAIDKFGEVHLLCNNAGVAAGSSAWECSLSDWKWVIDVNLLGVINCVQAFVPKMLAQNTEGHIVNTSSMAGLAGFHPSAPYQVTKHGIIALSENMHHYLAMQGSKLKVSVLCPGAVNTRIMDAERNRPEKLRDEKTQAPLDPEQQAMADMFKKIIENGMSPEETADHVFDAILNETFYILTHPEVKPMVQLRMEDILQERDPTPPVMEM